MKKNFILSMAFLMAAVLTAQTPVIEWQKSYGTSGYEHECHITATNDDGYLITGTSNSLDAIETGDDILVIKINSTGTVQWQKTLSGSGTDVAYSSIALPDGGYIIAGATESTDGDITVENQGLMDLWIIKLNSNGDIVWQKSYGGSKFDHINYGNTIKATPGGGFIVAGITSSNDGDITNSYGKEDIWVVKFDSDGEMEWQKTLGGSLNDIATSIALSPEDGYIVAGYTQSTNGDITLNHGSNDVWVVKLDVDGDIIWQRTYGGTGDDRAYIVNSAPNGGYYVTGNSSASNGEGDVSNNNGWADVWVLKLEENGNLIWQKSLGGSSTDIGFSGAVTPNETYIVTGMANSDDGDMTFNHGDGDYWVAELNEDGELLWQKSFGGSGEDWAYSILSTTGGYIISGESSSTNGDVTEFFGNQDFWVVKLSTDEIGGLENVKQNTAITYPNPVKNVLNFQQQYKSVAVYSIDGKLVMQANMNTILNVSSLQQGTYILKVESFDNKTETIKILKN